MTDSASYSDAHSDTSAINHGLRTHVTSPSATPREIGSAATFPSLGDLSSPTVGVAVVGGGTDFASSGGPSTSVVTSGDSINHAAG